MSATREVATFVQETMTNQTPFRVFFSCRSCGAVYSATQVGKPSKYIGRFECKKCNTTVHRWWGSQYSFTDWSRPLNEHPDANEARTS
jgi:transcription elongation factor Elf1